MSCNCLCFVPHQERIESLIKEIERLHERNAELVKQRDRFRFVAAKRRRT